MKITNIFLGLSIFFNISIALYVILRNKKRPANLLFSLFCFNLSLWALVVIFILLSNNVKTAEFWIRLAFLIGAFLPPNFYFFQKKLSSFNPVLSKKDRFLIILFYSISVVLGILCFNKFFVSKVTLTGWKENPYYSGPEAKYGPLFPIYIAIVLFVMFLSLVELKKKRNKSEGIFKTEIQYVFLAVLTGTIFVAITNLLAPYIWKTTIISQFAPFSSTLMISIIGYGIAKYRILSLQDFIERTWVYFLTSFTIGSVYFTFWFIFLSIFRFISPAASVISVLLAGFIAVLLFVPIENFIKRKVVSMKSTRQQLDEAETELFFSLTKISIFEELKNFIVPFIIEVLKVEDVKIFMNRGEYYINLFNENEKLNRNTEILKTLLSKKEILVYDHLLRERSSPDIIEKMKELDLFVIIPLFMKEQLVGFWGCGKKKSKETFFSEEMDFLVRVSMHISGKLESLDLYAELTRTKIYQETILENLTDGIICMNDEDIITVCNKKFTEILKIEKKDIVNKNYSKLPPLWEKMFEDLKEKNVLRDINVKFSINGEEKYFLVSGSLFFTEKRKRNYMLRISDITLIKQLEEEVRRAEKLASLGVMAAGLAHELKNPLVSIRTFSQLLPYKFDDPDFRDKFSKVIMEEVDRINSLIEQVLLFSRPQIGHIREMNVVDVLKNTVLMVSQSTNKKVNIIEKYPDEEIKIMGDPDKIKQVFLNIFINSFDAVGKDGKIEIDVSQENEMAKITIKDNGCGIKEENLNKIFDPFFTTKENGTGLGLSIVARIIDELKGRIRISSKEGKGTEVMVYFKIVNGGEK